MRTEICERLGIEYPIFAFTPSEKVAAAVSRAGGLGVLGHGEDAGSEHEDGRVAHVDGGYRLTAAEEWSRLRRTGDVRIETDSSSTRQKER